MFAEESQCTPAAPRQVAGEWEAALCFWLSFSTQAGKAQSASSQLSVQNTEDTDTALVHKAPGARCASELLCPGSQRQLYRPRQGQPEGWQAHRSPTGWPGLGKRWAVALYPHPDSQAIPHAGDCTACCAQIRRRSDCGNPVQT